MVDPKGESMLRERLSEVIAEAVPDASERLNTDPAVYLELVARTAQARGLTDGLLRSAVSAARGGGHSWEAIGQTLGMSRQAAQQRFGLGQQTPVGEARRLSPLSAFNEMEVLDRAGRYGWHSVGFGVLYHDLEQDEQQWEHLRAVVFTHSRRTLEAQGWQRVGDGWFPWVYYARPTGKTALPMPSGGLESLLRGE